MSAGKSKGAVPKLRFPEFQDAGGWEVKTLRDICNMRSGTFIPATEIYDVAQSHLFPCFGGNGLRGYVKTSTHEGKHPLIGRQGALCGNVNIVNGAFYATEHAVVVTAKPRIDVDWLYYQLIRLNLNQYATGQAQPGLSVDVLEKVVSITPTDPKEQRRIADCLGSLDDLIAAEGRKLETLRRHKQGLMQQLFPQDGETVPRLRFPEFCDTGEWEGWPLAKVAENLDSKRIPITENDRTKGTIPYYGASGIVDYVDDYIFDEDLLCISEDGANLVVRTYPIAFSISGKTWVNNHAHVLRFDDRARQTLVEAYLNATDLGAFLTGMAQPKLNRGMLDTIPISLPPQPAEQQRIADCLSTLDAVIASQTQKLDTLRMHKRSLLQQLFPSLEEEAA